MEPVKLKESENNYETALKELVSNNTADDNDTETIIIDSKKVMKGVSKVVVDKHIVHEDYEKVRVTITPLIRDITKL